MENTTYTDAARTALAGGTYPVYAHLEVTPDLALRCLTEAMTEQRHIGTDLGVKELAAIKATAELGMDGISVTHARTWDHLRKLCGTKSTDGDIQALMAQWLSDNAARSMVWTIIHSDEPLIDTHYDQLLRQAAAVLAASWQ